MKHSDATYFDVNAHFELKMFPGTFRICPDPLRRVSNGATVETVYVVQRLEDYGWHDFLTATAAEINSNKKSTV